MRFGLISSGVDGFWRAMRNATSAPPPRTATITANANRFLRARMFTSSDEESGRPGRESSSDVTDERGRGADAGAHADAAQGLPDRRQAGEAHQGLVDSAQASAVRAVVLWDAGARAPDLHDVGLAAEPGGAAEIAEHPSGDRGVVGV